MSSAYLDSIKDVPCMNRMYKLEQYFDKKKYIYWKFVEPRRRAIVKILSLWEKGMLKKILDIFLINSAQFSHSKQFSLASGKNCNE